MKTKSIHVRTRMAQNTLKQQLQESKMAGFLMGVRCGAVVSKELIKSGWTDIEGLEAEVSRRVRGVKLG